MSETMGNQQVDVHYVHAAVPGVVEENFAGFLEQGDLSLEEVLQNQEIVYQSLQINGGFDWTKASTSTDSNPNHERSGSEKVVQEKDGEPLQVDNAKSQLESDEALARALQELEHQDENESLSETIGTGSVNREVNSTNNSAQAVTQDNVDPDNMTYEQLQSLGESIGTENRGLSDELISYLTSYKYKTGFFSKKDKHEECVICCMAYKNRDVLTTLPCQHQYHSKCIGKWLKLNRACPICNEEVFGS